MAERAISVNNVQMAYGAAKVLKGVSLAIDKGEVLAIIGPSGSGKSTLLRMLIGLSKPTGGSIFINGRQVDSFSEKEWNRLRKSMGMVFQYSALFDSMTVGDNVAFGLRQHTDKTNEEILSIVEKTLETIGLAGYSGYMPGQLSGGMKKRVSLARAIATTPEILLYDEPTAGLDPVVADVINNLMLETKKRMKVTSVLVTHDMYSAFMVADRIAMIHEGLIIAEGTPAEILKCEHEIVKTFIHKAMPPGGIINEQ
ncbi:MAG: ABC transporter ATP-binding protein [Acidaminococcales bacterium]|nr:ABC transporter ATP-binding protein [Acidaminococcales bacterium]